MCTSLFNNYSILSIKCKKCQSCRELIYGCNYSCVVSVRNVSIMSQILTESTLRRRCNSTSSFPHCVSDAGTYHSFSKFLLTRNLKTSTEPQISSCGRAGVVTGNSKGQTTISAQKFLTRSSNVNINTAINEVTLPQVKSFPWCVPWIFYKSPLIPPPPLSLAALQCSLMLCMHTDFWVLPHV